MKPEGMPITSSSADDDDHGADGGSGEFQCSHFDFPGRANGIGFGGARWGAAGQASLSRKGTSLKEAKNIPRLLQCYVTYDTLLSG